MHKLFLVSAVVLALGTAADAQRFTSPPGFDTKTTGGFAGFPFAVFFQGQRSQHADQDMPSSARVIRQLQLRSHTNRAYAGTRGAGRTISNAVLSLAYTDCAKMTTTFSSNYMGGVAPKVVWKGNYSLPTFTGTPKQSWGNAVTFAFSTTFVWTPNKNAPHLLQEWTHASGRLTNGLTGIGFNYDLDGGGGPVTATMTPTSPGNSWLPRTPNTGAARCADSAFTNRDAFSELSLQLFQPDYVGTAGKPGHIQRVRALSCFTAPGKPVINFLTALGSDTGINIGFACNRLHANPGLIIQSVAATTGTFSGCTPSGVPPIVQTPYDAGWEGLPLYWQGVWTDSKTGRASLTIASKIVLPRLNGSNGCTVYAYKNTAGAWVPTQTGNVPGTGLPVVRNAFNNYTERWN